MKSIAIKSFFLAATLILCVSCNAIAGGVHKSSSTDSKVRTQMGAGILMMEGTALEVSSEQAKSLLPLWKAVKNLTNDDSVPEAEITAVYRQMQESLSTEQLQQIRTLNWSNADLGSLVERYNIQTTNAAGASQSQAGAAPNPGGGMPIGGGPGGDLAGGMGAGEMGGAPQSQGAVPSGMPAGSGTGELNLILADTIISVLQNHLDV